jgi:SAM-dependent methyltransferase
MARRGAEVVGLDLSPRLLARAQASEADEPLGIVYVQGDASDVRTLAAEQFDVIVCNFGLSDIDDLDGAYESVSRLLRPYGHFAFSILHPCFPGVRDVSGSWPTDAVYYDEGRWTADGRLSGLRREVGANHRMLSSYLNALIAHDLSIEVVAEPPPEEDWAALRPGAQALPVYLVVRSKPIGVG